MNLLRGILFFLVNVFLSFLEIFKTNFHGLLHSKQEYRFTHVYPSLRTKNIPSSCTYEFEKDPSFEPHKQVDHPYKKHDATTDTTSFSEPPVKYLQPSSNQECPPLPSESASLNPTTIG